MVLESQLPLKTGNLLFGPVTVNDETTICGGVDCLAPFDWYIV